MTTVVFKDGILASDSRLTFKNNICTDKCKKIWRLRDGTLYGSSGDNEAGLMMLDALRKGREFARQTDREFWGLRILPKGQIFLSEGLIWDRWPEKFAAIGSGAKFAIPAMRAGATAYEAVQIACQSDMFSGGRVQWLRLRRMR